MKKRIFIKYEILGKIHENQEILNKNTGSISINQIRNDMRKGDKKLIYDICNNYKKGGLLKIVKGVGFKRQFKITTLGINRIQWYQKTTRE